MSVRFVALLLAIVTVMGSNRSFADIQLDGRLNDNIPSVIYRPSSGELWLDTAGVSFSTIELVTFEPVLSPPDPPPFCGLIDPCWLPNKYFRLDPSGFTSFRLPQRVLTEPSADQLSTWDANGSKAGGGGYSSEPTSPNSQLIDMHLTGVVGDVDGNGLIAANDIDLFSQANRQGSLFSLFDMNADERVDQADRTFWVHELAQTWLGDVNLDGEFNSQDLVQLFSFASYEDGRFDNTWATGDFDGDGEFGSADLIVAFQDGGFELGPRAATVRSVPEPDCDALLLVIFLAALRRFQGRPM